MLLSPLRLLRLGEGISISRSCHDHLKGAIVISMKTSIEIDEATWSEIESTASLIREKPATVIRLAVRNGLPAVANKFQAPRPNGYFAGAYKHWPEERARLEEAMSKPRQHPER
jgi:hypothetical protein